MSRWLGRLALLGVAFVLGWSYADSFMHPTFFGDQGLRLDQAAQLVAGAGRRVCASRSPAAHSCPATRVRAPVVAPTSSSRTPTWSSVSFCWPPSAALCCAVTAKRSSPGILLPVAFAGSSFNWLGRSLCQEVLVLPIFLALVYLHYFAPARRGLFVAVLAAGMLTREVFWVWWAVFLILHWREPLRDLRFRAATITLGAIPLLWLLATRQSPLLARNTAEEGGLARGFGERAAILGRLLVSESLLPALACLAVVFGAVLLVRGRRGLSFRSYHVFSLASLGALYGYILLFDPWNATPENSRALVPIFAHILFWTILAWRDTAQLPRSLHRAGRIIAALGMLSMLKVHAIAAVLAGASPQTGVSWEPLHLATSLSAAEDWRTALDRAVRQRRAVQGGSLRVAFVGVPQFEYVKFWVAPFLYDERRSLAPGERLPAADFVVGPESLQAPGGVLRERLRLPGGIVRDVLELPPEARR